MADHQKTMNRNILLTKVLPDSSAHSLCRCHANGSSRHHSNSLRSCLSLSISSQLYLIGALILLFASGCICSSDANRIPTNNYFNSTALIGKLFTYRVPPTWSLLEADKLPQWLQFNENQLQGVPPIDVEKRELTVKFTNTFGSTNSEPSHILFVRIDHQFEALEDVNSLYSTIYCQPSQYVTVISVLYNKELSELTPSQRISFIQSHSRSLNVPEKSLTLYGMKNELFSDTPLVFGSGDISPRAAVSLTNGVGIYLVIGCGMVQDEYFKLITRLQHQSEEGHLAQSVGHSVIKWRVVSDQPLKRLMLSSDGLKSRFKNYAFHRMRHHRRGPRRYRALGAIDDGTNGESDTSLNDGGSGDEEIKPSPEPTTTTTSTSTSTSTTTTVKPTMKPTEASTTPKSEPEPEPELSTRRLTATTSSRAAPTPTTAGTMKPTEPSTASTTSTTSTTTTTTSTTTTTTTTTRRPNTPPKVMEEISPIQLQVGEQIDLEVTDIFSDDDGVRNLKYNLENCIGPNIDPSGTPPSWIKISKSDPDKPKVNVKLYASPMPSHFEKFMPKPEEVPEKPDSKPESQPDPKGEMNTNKTAANLTEVMNDMDEEALVRVKRQPPMDPMNDSNETKDLKMSCDLTVVDQFDANVSTPIEFIVERRSINRLNKFSHKFELQLNMDFDQFVMNPENARKIIDKLAIAFSLDPDKIVLLKISEGSVVVQFTVEDWQAEPGDNLCPLESVKNSINKLSMVNKKNETVIKSAFITSFVEYDIISLEVLPVRKVCVLNPAFPKMKAMNRVEEGDDGQQVAGDEEESFYITTVVPIAIIGGFMLIAAFVAFCLYRKKRQGSMSPGVSASDDEYVKKPGAPVIFANEMDQQYGNHNGRSGHFEQTSPLIMDDEKPAQPPPEYHPRDPHGGSRDLGSRDDSMKSSPSSSSERKERIEMGEISTSVSGSSGPHSPQSGTASGNTGTASANDSANANVDDVEQPLLSPSEIQFHSPYSASSAPNASTPSRRPPPGATSGVGLRQPVSPPPAFTSNGHIETSPTAQYDKFNSHDEDRRPPPYVSA